MELSDSHKVDPFISWSLPAGSEVRRILNLRSDGRRLIQSTRWRTVVSLTPDSVQGVTDCWCDVTKFAPHEGLKLIA